MSTEFAAQGVIELAAPAAESALVQSIVTRGEGDPLRSFEDVHAELQDRAMWLDVYGTSFHCHDQLRAVLARLARLAAQPFAMTGTAEGEPFAWYFGWSRREGPTFELTSKAGAIADQVRALSRRTRRSTDPRLLALRARWSWWSVGQRVRKSQNSSVSLSGNQARTSGKYCFSASARRLLIRF